MLSSAKIGRSSWRYYQSTVVAGACEYYAERGDAEGRWHGAGLAELGLVADAVVVERELEALFGRGLHPVTGVALGRAWRADAVTGHDLTFSAPKSVSALWALASPATAAVIRDAHTTAVHAALDYLQTHASYSRRGRDGVEQIATAGYAAALFDHTTSRAGDPQLHTHALVVNKVRCVDGVWRTIDGHEVFHHKKAAGVLYQSALRAELGTRLGVVFGEVSEHGQAEITGIPDALLTAWSTRTSAVMADAVPTIAEAEADLGRPLTPAERARIVKTAVLSTRPVKDHTVTADDLRARWRSQADQLGISPPELTAALLEARSLADGQEARISRAHEIERYKLTTLATTRDKCSGPEGRSPGRREEAHHDEHTEQGQPECDFRRSRPPRTLGTAPPLPPRRRRRLPPRRTLSTRSWLQDRRVS